MCRFGCITIDTTHMCKWCGTHYCKECLKGEFAGVMTAEDRCGKCHHPKCHGRRVEYVLTIDDVRGKGKGKRGRSPTKSARVTSSKGQRNASAKSPKKSGSAKKKSKGKKKKKK